MSGAQERAEIRAAVEGRSVIQQSAEMGEFYKAFLEAQRNMGAPRKTKEATVIPKNGGNPYKYKYSNLSQALEVIKPALTDAGIILFQPPTDMVDGSCVQVTKLVHAESGQWMESTFRLPPFAASPQSFGSASTYARRYQLCAMVGISADDEDDDGGRASRRGRRDADPEQPRRRYLPELPDGFNQSVLRQFAKQFDQVENADDLDYALGYWCDHLDDMARICRTSTAMTAVEDVLQAALAKVTTKAVFLLLKGALHMTDPKHADTLDAMADSKWRDGLREAREALPERAWNRIVRVVDHAKARVRPKAADSVAPSTAAASLPDGASGASDIDPTEYPEPEAPPATGEPSSGPVFFAQLIDHLGEVASEPFQDEVSFVKAYRSLLMDLKSDDADALALMNGEALDLAVRVPEARNLLEAPLHAPPPSAAHRTPEEMVVPSHDGGAPRNLAVYISEVRASIDLCNQSNIDAWHEANRTIIDNLAPGIKIKVLGLLSNKRVALGMRSASAA